MSEHPERPSYRDFRATRPSFAQRKDPFAAAAEGTVGENLGRLLETEEEWGTHDTLMATRLFIDGLWLNKADEVGSWISAAAVKTLGGAGSEKPISEIRKEMLISLQAEQERFYEERPVTAIAANIAGGVLSPVGLKGGQMLSRAKDVRTSALALSASDEVANTLSSLGRITPSAVRPLAATTAAGQAAGASTVAGLKATGTGAAAATRGGGSLAQQYSGLSPLAYNLVGRTPTPVLAAGAAAIEGGIIGAEGDTLGEAAKNALASAALGAGFSSLLSGAGFAVNAALKTKTAQQLGQGADFVSLMFTDHFAAPVYQHVIGKAFGAASFMEAQSRLISARLPNIDVLQQRGVNLVKNAAQRLNMAKGAIQKEGDDALESARQMAKALKSELTAEGKIELKDLDSVSKQRIAALEGKTGETIEQVQAAVARESEIATNAVEASFRTQAFQSSLPVATPAHVVEGIQAKTPREALQAVRDAWETYGYRAAKKAEVPVNRESLSGEIERIIKKAPEYALMESPNTPGGVAAGMAKYVDNMLNTALEGANAGIVSGQALVEIRSALGKRINELAQNNPAARAIVKPIQQHIDDLISRHISKDEAAEFAAESALWRTKSHLEDAAEKAISKEGAFSGEDWVKAAAGQSMRTATVGEGVLQKQAEASLALRKASNKGIEDTRDNTIRRVNTETKRLISDEKARLQSAKRIIDSEYRKKLLEISEQTTAEGKLLKQGTDSRIAREGAKEQWKLQLEDVNNQVERLRKAEERLNEFSLRGNTTIFEKMFATGLLAGVLGVGAAAVGGVTAGAMAAAVGTAAVITTQPAQRLLAKQTAWQKAGASIADTLEEVFKRTEAKFGVSPTRAAAIASAQPTREGTRFSNEVKTSIRGLPVARRADIFRSIERSGKLAQFKAQDPSFYKELERATQQ